jgi:hypothetical protein
LWPDAVPFSPGSGGHSPALDEIVRGPAAALTAVALVAGPRARASGWAAAAAVSIARRWTGPRRVLLVDLDLERPGLHELLNLSNDVGVVDLIAYGLTPRRCMQSADDGAFDLLAAGEFTLDSGAVLRDPAWTRLLLDAASRRATVLSLVPADAAGVAEVIDRAGAVLVLAEPDEADSVVASLQHPYAVLSVFTATASAPAETTGSAAGDASAPESAVREPTSQPRAAEPAAAERGAADPTVEPASVPATSGPASEASTQPPHRLTDEEFDRIRLPTDAAAREALIADLRRRQREARKEAPADSAPPPEPALDAEPATITVAGGAGEAARTMRVESAGDDVSLETLDPGPMRRTVSAPRRRLRRPLAWTLAVVLLASLLGGAWRYLASRLADRSAQEAPVPAPAAAVPPAPVPPSIPDETVLPFAVALEAHRDVLSAVQRVDALHAAEPELTFFVAPLERDDIVFYHVMAGPVADSAGALALRDTLIARRHKTAPTPTDVRAAPLAFLIGDYGSRQTAEQQLAELMRLDLPGYMVPGEAADGEPLYRVFLGGFVSRAEADVVRQLLRAAGIRDSLVTRTGSITQ